VPQLSFLRSNPSRVVISKCFAIADIEDVTSLCSGNKGFFRKTMTALEIDGFELPPGMKDYYCGS